MQAPVPIVLEIDDTILFVVIILRAFHKSPTNENVPYYWAVQYAQSTAKGDLFFVRLGERRHSKWLKANYRTDLR